MTISNDEIKKRLIRLMEGANISEFERSADLAVDFAGEIAALAEEQRLMTSVVLMACLAVASAGIANKATSDDDLEVGIAGARSVLEFSSRDAFARRKQLGELLS